MAIDSQATPYLILFLENIGHEINNTPGAYSNVSRMFARVTVDAENIKFYHLPDHLYCQIMVAGSRLNYLN